MGDACHAHLSLDYQNQAASALPGTLAVQQYIDLVKFVIDWNILFEGRAVCHRSSEHCVHIVY